MSRAMDCGITAAGSPRRRTSCGRCCGFNRPAPPSPLDAASTAFSARLAQRLQVRVAEGARLLADHAERAERVPARADQRDPRVAADPVRRHQRVVAHQRVGGRVLHHEGLAEAHRERAEAPLHRRAPRLRIHPVQPVVRGEELRLVRTTVTIACGRPRRPAASPAVAWRMSSTSGTSRSSAAISRSRAASAGRSAPRPSIFPSSGASRGPVQQQPGARRTASEVRSPARRPRRAPARPPPAAAPRGRGPASVAPRPASRRARARRPRPVHADHARQHRQAVVFTGGRKPVAWDRAVSFFRASSFGGNVVRFPRNRRAAPGVCGDAARSRGGRRRVSWSVGEWVARRPGTGAAAWRRVCWRYPTW